MPYLPAAIESILAQTFEAFELIIVDDASTDGTRGYLKSLRDSRVQTCYLPRNLGPGAARNEGIRRCRSDFLAVMDADDISMPARLEKQRALLLERPEICLTGSQYAYLGTDGHTGFGGPLPVGHDALVENLRRGQNAIVNGSMMCRTQLLRQAGGYGTGRCGEDWDLFLRMARLGSLANLPDRLYLYRLRAGSIRFTRLREERERIAFAIDNARRLEDSSPVQTFEEFRARWVGRPVHRRLADLIQVYSLQQYFQAVADILSERPVTGYSRLAWAALSCPWWTAQRVVRMVKKSLHIQ